jgi:3-oxoacyl-[acyl-carrier protein] reductase
MGQIDESHHLRYILVCKRLQGRMSTGSFDTRQECVEMLLKDRTAFITGAASGIGRAIAETFAENGANVTIADIDLEAANRVADEIRAAGGKAIAVRADVSSPESVATAVQATVKAFGGIDILVNNAGICPMKTFEDIPLDEWERVLAVNLTGAFICAQAVTPHLKKSKQGRIINVGSVAGRIGGLAVGAHYSVSKAGIMCLTKVLAKALAGYGITANSISPGTTETALTAGWSPETKETLRQQIPLRRLGKPEEMAAAALYLASDGASYVTGATLDVNGGLTMI